MAHDLSVPRGDRDDDDRDDVTPRERRRERSAPARKPPDPGRLARRMLARVLDDLDQAATGREFLEPGDICLARDACDTSYAALKLRHHAAWITALAGLLDE